MKSEILKDEKIEKIKAKVQELFIECEEKFLKNGHQNYHSIIVSTNGEVFLRNEASRILSSDEYFHEKPHQLTIYEWNGHRDSVELNDGTFYIDDDENGDYLFPSDNEEKYLKIEREGPRKIHLLQKLFGWRRCSVGDFVDDPEFPQEKFDELEEWSEENLIISGDEK